MRALRSLFRRFGRDESGTLMAEAVIVLPVLLWAYLALFVYWDAYRSLNTMQKASYTLSDMITREMLPVNQTYVNGMKSVMEYLIDDDQNVNLRVSSVTYSGVNQRFEIHWSATTSTTMPALTTATLQTLINAGTTANVRMPAMSDGDYVVLIETSVAYHPAFNVGLADSTEQQFIVTRPRFVPCIAFGTIACI